MYHRIANILASGGPIVTTDCPHCAFKGVFQGFEFPDGYDTETNYYFGQRRCPNPDCRGHVFFTYLSGNPSSLKIFPPAKINFDKSGVPIKVLTAFEEAITCHSCDCFIASAIMLRKTLEEICHDKGASGNNLFKRLEALANIILIPKELIDATQDLRLLGNDAAHLEAQTYEEIGRDEVEVSIEFTKEIIKAVYQYQNLLGKLRGLKREV